jgi:hypothetical protein
MFNQFLPLVTRDVNGPLFRWRDPAGVVHAIELAPAARGLALGAWWTRCGAHQISLHEAWRGVDEVTCPSCNTIERGM